jgi:hypothetical protein
MIRRYAFGKNGLVDAVGGPTATQLNEAAPVVIDESGAHFTNDSYSNTGGGSDGAGLSLGRLDKVVGGRTVHIDLLQVDIDSLTDNDQLLYFVFTGNATDPYDFEFVQSYALITRVTDTLVGITMFERLSLNPDEFGTCNILLPNEYLQLHVFLSFSLSVVALQEVDKYDVELAIYRNGSRGGVRLYEDSPYSAHAGDLRVGRLQPCDGAACNPLFGTIQSFSVDDQPLNQSIINYDSWDKCQVDEVPLATTSTTTVEGTTDGTTTSDPGVSSTSLVLTGRDLNGGGAVGLEEGESSEGQGSSLPLTLIIVLAALAALLALGLGALFVWRSRRKGRTVTASKVGARSNSDQQLLTLGVASDCETRATMQR